MRAITVVATLALLRTTASFTWFSCLASTTRYSRPHISKKTDSACRIETHALLLSMGQTDPPPPPDPHPPPTTVIELQLRSLQAADLGAVFEHASPANRRATGPLSRFATLFATPAYRPLLGFAASEMVSALPLGPGRYRVTVMISPEGSDAPRLRYSWTLGRQDAGEYEGRWMVDGVVLEGMEERVP
uniref:DUF4864 domain-containing protein n=1 Tax=Corethron hystrix TaxID=216773 RepID=A0A7S1BIQ9_9STRA|mmetsp:Transcript_27800/g.63670  ORF Transcript_27800/g.63670 Transcript_27800/m.63670 type:complete len:188 (+) Transcript_27800:33-596(+)